VPAKAAALAFAAVLVSGTAAAAVNGSLPAPVQRAVASTLSHVSISVPNPDDHSSNSSNGHRGNGAKNRAPGQTDSGRGSAAPSGPVGPDAGGTAKYGLCTAAGQVASDGRPDDAVAFANLREAASDAGMTPAEFCAGVTKPTGSTGPGTHPTGPNGATGPNGPNGPTGGPTGPTGPVAEPTTTTTTTTVPHGPPTSKSGNSGDHTPTTKPKGPTGPPTSHGGGFNSGSAHLPDQGDAGS
jgi:hypothetical protein